MTSCIRIVNMRQIWISIFDEHISNLKITDNVQPLSLLIELLYFQFQKVSSNPNNIELCSCEVCKITMQNGCNETIFKTPIKSDQSRESNLQDSDNSILNSSSIILKKSPILESKKKKIRKNKKKWNKLSLSCQNPLDNSVKENCNPINKLQQNIILTRDSTDNLKTININDKTDLEVSPESKEVIILESDDEFDTAIIDIENAMKLSNSRYEQNKIEQTSSEFMDIESILESINDNDKKEDKPEINDSYNFIPTKKEKPTYIFKGDACRGKSKRMKLEGWNCEDCKKYYEFLGITDEKKLKERMNKCSRHRSNYNPIYNTPEGFWNPVFTQDR